MKFTENEIYERLMRLGTEIRRDNIQIDLYPELPREIALASLKLDKSVDRKMK
tara:strand:- start:50 stop:208 length:159 start_codon:yes stop_codon:yes gene_type:complete